MTAIYLLLIAHFVGDFLCQSDWMAVNKSKSWLALTAHVCAYMFAVSLIVPFGLMLDGRSSPPVGVAVLWIGVNFAAHFVQDAITSRITSRLWFITLSPARDFAGYTHFADVQPDKRHWFFVAIGADQLLHYVTLFVTAEWWLR